MFDNKYFGLTLDYKKDDCKSDSGYDKDRMLRYHIFHTLSKTQEMFEWKIPHDTIVARDMELRIQTMGYTIIAPYEGKKYSLRGTLGGEPTFNYMPSRAIVANPYLNMSESYNVYYGYDNSKNLDLEKCVVIPNDALYVGLLPTLNMYLGRVVETDVTRRIVTIVSRAMNILKAGDDDTLESMKKVIEDLFSGKISAILDRDIITENTNSLPFAGSASSSRLITELIESEQYDIARLANEIGLQANYNMKREAINSNESQLNQDAILPFADNMLRSRKNACENIYKLWGEKWEVNFSSAWKYKRDEIEAGIENMKNENSEESKNLDNKSDNSEESKNLDNKDETDEDENK